MSDFDWKKAGEKKFGNKEQKKNRRDAYVYLKQVGYDFVNKKSSDGISDDFWRYYHTRPKYKYQIKAEPTKGTNKGRNKGRSWWTMHFKMTDAKKEIIHGDPYVKGRHNDNRVK